MATTMHSNMSDNISIMLPITLMGDNASTASSIYMMGTNQKQWESLIATQFTKVSDWIRVIGALAAAVTMVLGIPANIMIILAVYRTRSLRTSMNALVINLLVADLINCMFCCPVIIVLASTIPQAFVCKIFDFTHILSGSVQLLSIAFLSFERYQAIRKPFDIQQRLTRIKIGIVVCWLLGAILCIVSVCMTNNPVLHLCLDGPVTNSKYEFGLYIFLPLAALAITSIVAFYLRIVYQINDHVAKRQKKMAWKRKVNKVNPIVSVTVALVNGTSSNTQTSRELTSRRPSIENGQCSTIRTSISDNNLSMIPPFNTPTDLTTPIRARRTKSESETDKKVLRKTQSDSNPSGFGLSMRDLNLKPKYSEDSKMKQMGHLPLTVQGFLSPSRRRSYYHSNDDLSSLSPGPSRNKKNAASDQVTFTALDVLDAGGIQNNISTSSKSSSSQGHSNALVVKGGKCKSSVSPEVQISTPSEVLTEINFNKPESAANGIELMSYAEPSEEHPSIPDQVHLDTGEAHGLKSSTEGKTDEYMQEDSKPKRPTRRTAIIDIVQIHDFDGITTQSKIASGVIAGDICVMNKESKEQGKRKVEQRTAKRTAIIVAAFLGCWTPLLFSIIASVVLDDGSDDVIRVWCEAYLVTLSMAVLAGVINPVIYGVINNQFRAALIRMLKRFKTKWWCKNK